MLPYKFGISSAILAFILASVAKTITAKDFSEIFNFSLFTNFFGIIPIVASKSSIITTSFSLFLYSNK
ncbi:2877_t:CDS:2 [Cetraspora pellucida]|uniref:2877_t:CDS:1 n=1 Tax=Cetraspora pellucida TaxID=1433469 RepID=A0A9N9CH84_9GLOM|nr:2877_t:CDS:2 [Cetraspora pellucida]